MKLTRAGFAFGGYDPSSKPTSFIPCYVLISGILILAALFLLNVSLLSLFKHYKNHVTKNTYALQLMLYKCVIIHAFLLAICLGIPCFLLIFSGVNDYFIIQLLIHFSLSIYSFLNNLILLISIRSFKNCCADVFCWASSCLIGYCLETKGHGMARLFSPRSRVDSAIL